MKRLRVILLILLIFSLTSIVFPQARTTNRLQDVPFSQLSSPSWPNNTILGCINCQPLGGVCTSGGTGSIAIKLNGAFYCPLTTAPPGTGTVTSVALTAPVEFTVSGSPVTVTGTLTITKAVQGANTIYAGPSTGGAAQPAFRVLVPADIPALDAAKVNSGQFPIARLASGTPTGSKFIRDDGVLTAPATGGDFSSNTAVSVDSEMVLFSGTLGKTGKRATGTGFPLLTSGVVSVVSSTGTGNVVRSANPSIISPTGMVKADVGLGNVDDTSDVSKNSATGTLTNKTINGASNTLVVRDVDLSLSDVTNSNVSISAHGFVPKAPNDAAKCLLGDGTWGSCTAGAGGGDFSSNTSTSVDGELVLFSGTGGKTGRRATSSGVAVLTSGVLGVKTNPSGAFLGDTDPQTIGSKTIDNSNTVTVKDNGLTVQDNLDTTKHLDFQLSGITTGNTRTVTIPDLSGTLTLLGNTVTGTGSIVLAANPSLSSPTLSTPIISDFTNATHNHQAAAGGGTLDTAAIATGIFAGARGGTNNGFMQFSGPTSTLKTFTLPNASGLLLTDQAAVTVAQGGTGITSGNSGGIPYFSDTTTIAASGTLTANRLVVGGGTGVSPSVLGSLGTTVTLLHGNGAGAPSFAVVTPSDAVGNTSGSGNFALVTSATLTTPQINTRANFGGTTSSFPAVRNSGAALEVVLADNSAFASLNTGPITIQSGDMQIPNTSKYRWGTTSSEAMLRTAGGTTIEAVLADASAYTTVKASTFNATTGFQVNGGALAFSNLSGSATTSQLPAALANQTSINGLGITASTGTLTITNAKTLAVSNTLTLAGTDGQTMTFPATSATIARTDAANTFTGHQTVEGVTSTGATGTGKFVFDTAPQISTIELGAATDTTLARVGAGQISVEGVNVVTTASTDTLTNKRVTTRFTTVASTTTSVTIDVSTTDMHITTAQAGALLYNNPTGTPTEGQKLIIRIKDDGIGVRALTYGTQFRASSDLALPSTTILGKTLYMGFCWNATDSKFDLLAVMNNF